jgi:hypothetical protein
MNRGQQYGLIDVRTEAPDGRGPRADAGALEWVLLVVSRVLLPLASWVSDRAAGSIPPTRPVPRPETTKAASGCPGRPSAR